MSSPTKDPATTFAGTAWNPTLPVLSSLLYRMEDLKSPAVQLTPTEAVFCGNYVEQPPSGYATERTDFWSPFSLRHEPFPFADLIAEQVADEDRFLIALTQPEQTEHTFTHLTSALDGAVTRAPAEGYTYVQMTVRCEEWDMSGPGYLMLGTAEVFAKTSLLRRALSV